MNKIVHNAKIKVFIREDEEDPVAIETALLELVPFEDLEKEKITINREITTGAKDNRIFVLNIIIDRNRQVNQFLNFFKDKLSSADKQTIIEQLESRIDEGMNFFIRIDKEKFLLNREVVLTENGDCFHIKITVAAFPAKKETAIEMMRVWLSN